MDFTTTCQALVPKSVHIADEISASQIDHMLKRNEMDRDFLGIIQLVNEESEGLDVQDKSPSMQKPKWD